MDRKKTSLTKERIKAAEEYAKRFEGVEITVLDLQCAFIKGTCWARNDLEEE